MSLDTTANQQFTTVQVSNFFDTSPKYFCPAMFKMGFNLTPEERAENSHHPDGIWATSLAKFFSGDLYDYPLDLTFEKSTLAEIGYCFNRLDPRHYRQMHDKWIDEEKYFVGQKVGHDPSQNEWWQEYEAHHNSERFTVWYALMFPDKVSLRKTTPACELFVKLASLIRNPKKEKQQVAAA